MPGPRWLVAPLALVLSAVAVDAAVLCVKRRPDGTLSGTVKVRPACKPSEIVLAPDAVGFCCSVTTTTTSTSATTIPCPTTTTLGIPNCQANFCGPCLSGQACTDPGNGQCACTGPILCGGTYSTCGGQCGPGQTCAQLPVPPGCPSIGCSCQ